jgi:hypothetical protein
MIQKTTVVHFTAITWRNRLDNIHKLEFLGHNNFAIVTSFDNLTLCQQLQYLGFNHIHLQAITPPPQHN